MPTMIIIEAFNESMESYDLLDELWRLYCDLFSPIIHSVKEGEIGMLGIIFKTDKAYERESISNNFVSVETLPYDDGFELDQNDLNIFEYVPSGTSTDWNRYPDVKIEHKPSGLFASCRLHNTKTLNKRKALEILKAKVFNAET